MLEFFQKQTSHFSWLQHDAILSKDLYSFFFPFPEKAVWSIRKIGSHYVPMPWLFVVYRLPGQHTRSRSLPPRHEIFTLLFQLPLLCCHGRWSRKRQEMLFLIGHCRDLLISISGRSLTSSTHGDWLNLEVRLWGDPGRPVTVGHWRGSTPGGSTGRFYACAWPPLPRKVSRVNSGLLEVS